MSDRHGRNGQVQITGQGPITGQNGVWGDLVAGGLTQAMQHWSVCWSERSGNRQEFTIHLKAKNSRGRPVQQIVVASGDHISTQKLWKTGKALPLSELFSVRQHCLRGNITMVNNYCSVATLNTAIAPLHGCSSKKSRKWLGNRPRNTRKPAWEALERYWKPLRQNPARHTR